MSCMYVHSHLLINMPYLQPNLNMYLVMNIYFMACSIRRQMIKMVLGCEQIYYVSLCESHHSIRLAIVPDEDTLSSQSFRERWELIEELNIKLMEKVKTFMRASDPPQRYIPCYLCSKLHLTLDKIRANDKPLHCLEGGKLRKDYYLDLRRYEGYLLLYCYVHQ